MTHLSPEEYAALCSIPLQDVMLKNGHKPVYRTSSAYWYRCPHPGHDDRDASFHVDISPVGSASQSDIPMAGFNCFGCKQMSGRGALELQAQLLGLTLKGSDFMKVVSRLASNHGIDIEGIAPDSYKYSLVAPVSEFTYAKAEWTDESLKALGCIVSDVYDEPDEDGRESATGRKVYSWAMVDEPSHRRPVSTTASAIGADIEARFGIFPISEFTVPAKTQNDGSFRSMRRVASDYYHMFAIRTVDDNGVWRIKKYEPQFRQREGRPNYKWGWFYQGGANRNSEYKSLLYGDSDVMDALYHTDIVPTDTSGDFGAHPVVDVTHYNKDGVLVTDRKFRRVVICSGPRDALQVYYHSDCHVVYPHSETASIDSRLIKRLFLIAEQVYVLFDSDPTGIRQSRDLCLEYLQLRNIELPSDLTLITDPRTGRPSKDASGYFEHYPSRLRFSSYRTKGIDAHFDDLLSSSIPCQFWKRTRVQSNAEKPLGKCHYNYSLDDDSMKRFLYYSGMGKIEERKNIRFVFVKDNIVDIIHDKQVVVTARMLMKDWLRAHPSFYDPDLSTRIATSKQMLSYDALLDLPTMKLNFIHWGETWDYLFFKNGALFVSSDRIELRPYASLDFHVNREAILPHTFTELPPCFVIEPNPQLEEYERAHRERLDIIPVGDTKSVASENESWQQQRALWPYRLHLLRPMNDMPVAFQYVYDTGRMYWREELAAKRDGVPRERWLSPERHQFQDMQFINKAAGIGYILSRYRSTAMSRMGYVIDYNVMDELKATGRTGKSIIGNLLKCVRYCCSIPGKNFKTSADMSARNFKDYDYLRDGYINVNDLLSTADPEMFYNWAEGEMTKKNLNHDEVEIPREMAAKLLMSCNKIFDISVNSTRGRLWIMLFGDYYHLGDSHGLEEWSPYMKFGYTLGSGDTPHEFQETINMFVRFLQFYLSVRTYIEPPVGTAGRRRQLYARKDIKDKRFIEWADSLFRGGVFYGVPIPKLDLIVSWFQFTGRQITFDLVSNYSRSTEFTSMLSAYCSEMRISVNPSSVYSAGADRSRLPSCRVWRYDFDSNTGFLSRSRSMYDRQSCYYFFPMGAEPSDISSVMRAHVDTSDPACEGYIFE